MSSGSPDYRSASGSPAHSNGGSILRQERANEDRKQSLPLDEHRATVRSETETFIQHVSPQRARDYSGSPARNY